MGPHCSIWHHWSCSVNWLPWAVAGYLRFSISWLRSYLSNRIFSVKMGNSSSSSADVPCGIPQGSFLVSILYSLKYITKYQWSHLEIVGKDTVLGFFLCFYTDHVLSSATSSSPALLKNCSYSSNWSEWGMFFTSFYCAWGRCTGMLPFCCFFWETHIISRTFKGKKKSVCENNPYLTDGKFADSII